MPELNNVDIDRELESITPVLKQRFSSPHNFGIGFNLGCASGVARARCQFLKANTFFQFVWFASPNMYKATSTRPFNSTGNPVASMEACTTLTATVE